MFSELIYTRCRQGVDILKGGAAILNDGFKVYACSDELYATNSVDLPFLLHLAQGKQSYTDPTFMEDAYLYVTPDAGDGMMVNFHPIHFDPSVGGGYAHRPGNFINQIYIGDFGQVYPYELFGNRRVWDAQARGEAYYYEHPPTALLPRSDMECSGGSIGQADVAAFVADGRREAVAQAVDFLLEQFAQPPENRKYLIIQDGDAARIELWMAAIQSAFSPSMASGLSFATRLDKFTTANKYTVNQRGCYQVQMNLQDSKQRTRLKAMMVGVDERDRVNTAAVRPMPHAPFGVLDGKNRTFVGGRTVTHPYYAAITAQDERQKRFCREFLPMFEMTQPNRAVLSLYEAFAVLDDLANDPATESVAGALSIIGRYKWVSCSYSMALYERIKTRISTDLQENLSAAFAMIQWLRVAANVVGEASASDTFTHMALKAFCASVFREPRGADTQAIWLKMCDNGIPPEVAATVVDEKTASWYDASMRRFSGEDWAAFAAIYVVCAGIRPVAELSLTRIIEQTMHACSIDGTIEGAVRIGNELEKSKPGFIGTILRYMAKRGDVSAVFYVEVLVQSVIDQDLPGIIGQITESDELVRVLVQYILSIPENSPNAVWNAFLTVMARMNHTGMKEAIVEACLSCRQPDQKLAQLERAITDPACVKVFRPIAAVVSKEVRKVAPPSKLGRLFGFGMRSGK